MKVTKFKTKDGEVFVDYINTNGDEVSIKSKEQPLDSLNSNLQRLGKYVIEICELPDHKFVEVTGISISHNLDTEGQNVRGVVLVSKLKLTRSTGVINLITPHRIERYYAEHGDEGQLMPDGMIEDVDILIENIKDYINGERIGKQEELFETSN